MFFSVQAHFDQSAPRLSSHHGGIQTISFGVGEPIIGMTTAELVELHVAIGAHLRGIGAIQNEAAPPVAIANEAAPALALVQ